MRLLRTGTIPFGGVGIIYSSTCLIHCQIRFFVSSNDGFLHHVSLVYVCQTNTCIACPLKLLSLPCSHCLEFCLQTQRKKKIKTVWSLWCLNYHPSNSDVRYIPTALSNGPSGQIPEAWYFNTSKVESFSTPKPTCSQLNTRLWKTTKLISPNTPQNKTHRLIVNRHQ